MEKNRLLYLIGGSQAFESMADSFVLAAGGNDARILLLFQSGDERGLRHLPEYVDPWKARGVIEYDVFCPDTDGNFDLAHFNGLMKKATGIFIGGGDTNIYQNLYCQREVSQLIREKYLDGVPIAGCSAGALILLKHCVIKHEDTREFHLEILPGVGLLDGFVIGVHFSERNQLNTTLSIMVETNSGLAYGIDEAACVVFRNGEYEKVLGRNAYRIEMKDFANRDYVMKKL